MDNTGADADLAYLQAHAVGPDESFELHEHSLGKALACAAIGLVAIGLGGWLASLPMLFGAQTASTVKVLLWAFGAGLVGIGLVALVSAWALYQRHGRCALAVTRETVAFANALAPVPWEAFEGFDVEQRRLSTHLMFSLAAFGAAPVLKAPGFKALAAPDAQLIAGGLRLKVWACNFTRAGRRLALAELVDVLYPYLQAAQARRTLAQLFPAVARQGDALRRAAP